MDNIYELFLSLDKLTKSIYEKHYNSENYEVIFNEDGLLLVKKTNNESINLDHEKIILDVVRSMSKKYKPDGIVHIDLSNEIKSILEKIKDDEIVRGTDNRITWPIRQALTKAIILKKNSI